MRNEQVNIAWCTVLLQTVSKTPPPNSMVGEEFDREKHHWWKAKKWAFFNLNRLFIRYGSHSLFVSGYQGGLTDMIVFLDTEALRAPGKERVPLLSPGISQPTLLLRS